MEEVVLVNEKDEAVGTMEKMEAHVTGTLHRAISVFIFNSNGELLLHQRALSKYHSPGLWTNTCCSHPRPNEETIDAANRRLQEEMGMQAQLSHAFSFQYRSEFDNDLIEHELDHVFVGNTDQVPSPDPSEVATYRYISWNDLQAEIDADPERFTTWFRICLPKVKAFIEEA